MSSNYGYDANGWEREPFPARDEFIEPRVARTTERRRSMNTVEQVITIERTESGQRRSYGDSYFGALITFAFSDGSAWTATEKQARQIAATALRYGSAIAETESAKENWAQGYFESVRAEGPGKWRVLIVEPYTD